MDEPSKHIEKLTKSRVRIADHGEVFTPLRIVQEMLDLFKGESERIDSRFLEPACGEGNFLVEVLRRKLDTVQNCYGKSDFERKNYALVALMSIYGIELLADNSQICRDNLVKIFASFVEPHDSSLWIDAATVVTSLNIVHADALTMQTPNAEPIVFPEWGYLGRGKFQRRDFQYQALTLRSSFAGTLFDQLESSEIFTAKKSYPPATVEQIAALKD